MNGGARVQFLTGFGLGDFSACASLEDEFPALLGNANFCFRKPRPYCEHPVCRSDGCHWLAPRGGHRVARPV